MSVTGFNLRRRKLAEAATMENHKHSKATTERPAKSGQADKKKKKTDKGGE